MSDERDMLRRTVQSLVDKHAAPDAVRRAMASDRGYDEALWTLLCDQVGAAALVIPEELGGGGGELADAAIVLETLGRNLVPTPLLGTTLAELALLSTNEPAIDTLAGLAAGTSIGAVVLDVDERLREENLDVDERLREEQPAGSYVINGDVADVVLAVEAGRLTRWSGVTAEPLVAMDPTRRLARVVARDRTVLGRDPGMADLAAILLAAEQVGAASRCLELTVTYTRERVQFGRPIGSFQALKHRMADLYVLVQSARSVVDEAVADPSPTLAALARIAASEAFSAVAAESIQMHGGVAITWEYDIQLYFKRAHGSAQLLGPPRDFLRRLESEVL